MRTTTRQGIAAALLLALPVGAFVWLFDGYRWLGGGPALAIILFGFIAPSIAWFVHPTQTVWLVALGLAAGVLILATVMAIFFPPVRPMIGIF